MAYWSQFIYLYLKSNWKSRVRNDNKHALLTAIKMKTRINPYVVVLSSRQHNRWGSITYVFTSVSNRRPQRHVTWRPCDYWDWWTMNYSASFIVVSFVSTERRNIKSIHLILFNWNIEEQVIQWLLAVRKGCGCAWFATRTVRSILKELTWVFLRYN